jgi:hypothetical protein
MLALSKELKAFGRLCLFASSTYMVTGRGEGTDSAQFSTHITPFTIPDTHAWQTSYRCYKTTRGPILQALQLYSE